jgi:hypothetical protein
MAEDGGRQLVVRADFEDDDDYDEDDEDDEDDDDDFAPDEDEIESIEIDVDDALSEETGLVAGDMEEAVINDRDELAADEKDLSTKAKVKRLQAAFPKAPRAVCKHILAGSQGDIDIAYVTLSRGFKPTKPRKALAGLPEDLATLTPRKTRSTTKSTKGKNRLLLEDNTELDLVDENGEDLVSDYQNSLLDYYDHHGLPPGSISTGNNPAKLDAIFEGKGPKKIDLSKTSNSGAERSGSIGSAKIVRFATGNDIATPGDAMDLDDEDDESDEDFDVEPSNNDSDSDSSSESSSDNSDSESTSSSGSNSSSDDSSSEDSSSSSSSDSDSDSDSDEAPEETSSKVEPPTQRGNNAMKTGNEVPKAKKPDVAPGNGTKSTKSRNQRRQQTQVLKKMQEKGIIPANVTLNEFKRLDLNSITNMHDVSKALAVIRGITLTHIQESTSQTNPMTTEFEVRRRRLLASLASGGVEIELETVSPKPKSQRLYSEVKTDIKMMDVNKKNPSRTETARLLSTTERGASQTTTSNIVIASPIDIGTAMPEATAPTVSPESANSSTRPRSRLNLGAGRRLLFGALGIKTPKSKSDEEKVRSDLMKYVRAPKVTNEAASAESLLEEEDDDPDVWREKITLRGVECCYEGIELSEPPFPFVQRWDPQQQGGYGKRGGKGKRNQRNQSQYYDAEPQSKKKKRKNDQSTSEEYYDAFDQYYEPELDQSRTNDDVPGNIPITSDPSNAEVSDQIMRDVTSVIAATSQTEVDDLPLLPDDIAALPNLINDQIKIGSVIAFKQLIMSESTNWQPEMSQYRTAVVIKSSENGDLELTLAKRDRAESEKYYDEETGERIYGKFDMPDDDDDEEMEDDGFLNLSFAELVEPKVVQQAPQTLEPHLNSSSNIKADAGASPDASLSVRCEDGSNSPQKSIEIPISHDNNVDLNQEGTPGGLASIFRGQDSIADNNEVMGNSLSEEDRHNISKIIPDTRFRPTIPSSVLRAQPQYLETPADFSQVSQDESIIDVTEYSQVHSPYSPKFNGLDSTPPDLSTPIKISSPNQTEHEASSLEKEDSYIDPASAYYPKLSAPSSAASQVTDHGRQPDFPTPGDDTLNQFDDLNALLESLDNAESFLVNEPKLHSPVAEPHVDQVVTLGRDLSPISVSSSEALPSLEVFFSTQDLIKKEGAKSRAKTVVVPKVNVDEADSYDAAMAKLDAQIDGAEDIDPINIDRDITPKASKSQRGATQHELENELVVPARSQLVDLTLSSDIENSPPKKTRAASKKAKLLEGDVALEDVGDEHNDSYGLPRGPGWVQKKRRAASTGSEQSSKTQSQSQRRSTRKSDWR